MGKRQHPTPPVTDAEEGFLSRWSRRKSEARTVPAVSEPEENRPAAAGDAGPATEPESPLTDADLPPLESLDENSDFSGFLSPGVSDALRRRALRKLFASAKFQIRDGLDDYDEDYRNFETLGNTLTANLRHRARMEAERMARLEPADSVQEPAPEEPVAGTEPPPAADEAPSTADAGSDPTQRGTRS